MGKEPGTMSLLVGPIRHLSIHVPRVWRRGADGFGKYPLPRKYEYMESDEDPPLRILNRAYCSRVFRKLHVEAAVKGGFGVFHCVMFPYPTIDLPILSMDLVSFDGRVSLAIADPCPVTDLSDKYERDVLALQDRYDLASNRSVPPWGRSIFSKACIIMRPTPDELLRFQDYAVALTEMHIEASTGVEPCDNPGILTAHRRYCRMQLGNEKTRRVLEASFGPAVADEYMRTVMFDVE